MEHISNTISSIDNKSHRSSVIDSGDTLNVVSGICVGVLGSGQALYWTSRNSLDQHIDILTATLDASPKFLSH